MKLNLLKKTGIIATSLALIIGTMGTNSKAALEDGTYKVPVKLQKAFEDVPSMGDGALERQALVKVKDGKPEINLYFKGLTFMNMYGHLLELSTYPEGVNLQDSNRTATPTEVSEKITDKGLDGQEHEFPRAFKFTRENTDEKFIPVRVVVDAMEEIAKSSGQSGRGEQDAKVMIDYASAEKTEDSTIGNSGGSGSQQNANGSGTGNQNNNNTKKPSGGTATNSSSNTSSSSPQKSSSNNASKPEELPKTGSLLNARGVALASVLLLSFGILIRKKGM